LRVGAGLARLLPAGLRAQTAQPAPSDIVKSKYSAKKGKVSLDLLRKRLVAPHAVREFLSMPVVAAT